MLSRIKPIVKHGTFCGKIISIGKLCDADFSISLKRLDGELSKNAANELYCGLDALMNVMSEKSKGKLTISLELSDDVPTEIEKNADQAYCINATDNKIELIGYGEAGLYYAVNTFLQTIHRKGIEFFVPEMKILDFPDLKTRGHFIETRFGSNLMTLEDWKSVIDNMASMKLRREEIDSFLEKIENVIPKD